jgi:hypothetical protein
VLLDYLKREDSRVNSSQDAMSERSIFDGIDTTWSHVASLTRRPNAALLLDSAARAFEQARRDFRPTDPSTIVEPLARAIRLLRQNVDTAKSGIRVPPPIPSAQELAFTDAVQLSIQRAERALLIASGIVVEAVAPRTVFPVREAIKVNVDDSLLVTVHLYNRGKSDIRLEGTATWGNIGYSPERVVFRENRYLPRFDTVTRTIRPDSSTEFQRYEISSAATQSWWRTRPRLGAWYSTPLSGFDDMQLQAMNQPSIVTRVAIAGVPLDITTPIVARFADPVKGELQVPVAAVPGITVGLEAMIEYIRADVPLNKEVEVRLLSAYPESASVSVRLNLPKGLKPDSASRTRVLTPSSPFTTVTFKVTGMVQPGLLQQDAIATQLNTQSFTGYQTISYDHIPPQRMYTQSAMYLSSVNVNIPARAHVGYIAGVSDNGMAALQQLDITVEQIQPTQLANMDLSRFTSIVIGPRAYDAHPALVANNKYLLAYAARGGTLVVQYGQYEMMQPGIMPYPIELTRPAARVTDEGAAVKVLAPESPILTRPNRITSRDWEDWVQERGTYMPSVFDKRYVPLLSMNDPDEQEVRSGILVAPVGKGKYVYVTLALFRQLPNGIPGAARLFTNIVSAMPPASTPPKM